MSLPMTNRTKVRDEHKTAFDVKLAVRTAAHTRCAVLSPRPSKWLSQLIVIGRLCFLCVSMRCQAELQRLQDRTESELDAIRLRQSESYERDIASLREARDNALLELAQTRQQQSESRAAAEQLRSELSASQLQWEKERADQRQGLAIKQFEYERLSVAMEDTMAELSRLRAELEAEARKQRIVRSEYEALKQSAAQHRTEADSRMESLSEKLQTYTQLEHELDLAIVGAGKAESEAGLGPGEVRGIHRILESISDNLPLANKRRLQQSILLAQQLVDKQRRLNDMQKQLDDRTAAYNSQREQVTPQRPARTTHRSLRCRLITLSRPPVSSSRL